MKVNVVMGLVFFDNYVFCMYAGQEKEILQLLKEKELLQQEAEISRVKLEQQDKTIQNLKGSTDAAQHIISTLQKQQVESKVCSVQYAISELPSHQVNQSCRP